MTKLYNGDSCEILKTIEDNSIDLTVTSPPYDDLRNYGNTLSFNFDTFKTIAQELYRVTKDGGVVIWVVADKTQDGSESGTSFKQALYFKEVGFNLHDTMIYRKINYVPLTHNRYEQEWEYMFCLSKGKPKTFNPIKIPCKYAGTESWGKVGFYRTDGDDITYSADKKVINEEKIKGNIFEYRVGSTNVVDGIKHPAVFPIDLAKDQIKSWSNKGDTVLDPFMGSGTTGQACLDLQRDFIGIELNEEYYEMCQKRLKVFMSKTPLI